MNNQRKHQERLYRSWFNASILVILAACLSACGFSNLPVATEDPASVERFQAIDTQVAAALTFTPEPPPFLSVPPTVTLPPDLAKMTVSKNLNQPCSRAEFVRDVTIPDGIFLPAGTQFTKIWELKNNGKCTWDGSYALTDAGEGKAMGVEGPVTLFADGEVGPGEIVQVSLELTAPQEIGSYRSYWKLMDGQGKQFGVGQDGSQAFWLEIRVADRYDFAGDICSASWRNSTSALPCPMQEGGNEGFAVHVDPEDLGMEEFEPELALLMVPENTTGGTLTATYPPIMVPAEAHYRALPGCLDKDKNCSAVIELRYKLEGGYEAILGSWQVMQGGAAIDIDLDLTQFSLPGSQVEFILAVTSQGASSGDLVYLADPQIIAVP